MVPSQNKNYFKVLSIDGGGVRGIIPALLLYEIEQRLETNICKLFNLIAGTSTGGVMAMGFTIPDEKNKNKPKYSAMDAINFYTQQSKNMFSSSISAKIKSLGGLLDEKYHAKGIENILGQFFGDARLKDVLTEIIIPSYDLERHKPFFFKSRHAKNQRNGKTEDFLLKHVARATTAAPTYFAPTKIETHDICDYYALIDGGMVANNPSMCAYSEAKRILKERNESDRPILLISLGTGQYIQRLTYNQSKHRGITRWIKPLLKILFDGISQATDYQVKNLLNEDLGHNAFYRFQIHLNENNKNLDDASDENVKELKLLTEDFIQENNDRIKEMCEKLKFSR